MPVGPERVADAVFQTLKGFGFQLKIYDSEGNAALDPSAGRRFFATPGNIMVSLVESPASVNLYLSDVTDVTSVGKLMEQLKSVVTQNNYQFNVRKYGKKITPKDFAFVGESDIRGNNMEYKVDEARNPMIGSQKSSYQNWNSARLIVRHNKPISEESVGARSRNIQKIFIETNEGERFKFPVVHLTGARAMARHIGAGGSFNDKAGQHIIGLSEQFKDLQRVNRYIFQNRESLQEDAFNLRDSIRSTVNEIKHELNRFMTVTGYTAKIAEVETLEATPLNEENLAEEVKNLRAILMVSEGDTSLDVALSKVARSLNEKKRKNTEGEADPALVKLVKDAYGEGEADESEFVDAAKLLADPSKLQFTPANPKAAAKKAEYAGKMSPMHTVAWRLGAISERMKPTSDGALILSAILSRIATKIEMTLDSAGPTAPVKVNSAQKQIASMFIQKVAPVISESMKGAGYTDWDISEARPLGHPEGYVDPDVINKGLAKQRQQKQDNIIGKSNSIRKAQPDTSILKPEFRRKRFKVVSNDSYQEAREISEWFENFNPIKILTEKTVNEALNSSSMPYGEYLRGVIIDRNTGEKMLDMHGPAITNHLKRLSDYQIDVLLHLANNPTGKEFAKAHQYTEKDSKGHLLRSAMATLAKLADVYHDYSQELTNAQKNKEQSTVESMLGEDEAWNLADFLVRGKTTPKDIVNCYEMADRKAIAAVLKENWTNETTEAIIKNLAVDEVANAASKKKS
ncbi:MAG: hypothetical protein HC836_32790 [Richelia sp. RM2_1_2]|nr:hypothetical protein [Richelia sp. RM2_1_2]